MGGMAALNAAAWMEWRTGLKPMGFSIRRLLSRITILLTFWAVAATAISIISGRNSVRWVLRNPTDMASEINTKTFVSTLPGWRASGLRTLALLCAVE